MLTYRRHRYHIHTPFSRPEHLSIFLPMIEETGATWYPICEQHEAEFLPTDFWIKPMICPKCPPTVLGFPGSYKSNWFLNHTKFVDDDRYLLLNDDDFYEPHFLDKIDAVDGDLLICSMLMGQNSWAHGETLIAKKENLKSGRVGGEQIIMSGSAQRQFRLGSGYEGDWEMLKNALTRYTPTFVPDAFVYFDRLCPGSWFDWQLIAQVPKQP